MLSMRKKRSIFETAIKKRDANMRNKDKKTDAMNEEQKKGPSSKHEKKGARTEIQYE